MANELGDLRRWVLEDRCRLVALLGMGGIGKTSLAARLAQGVAPSFERVYWRSLRNAPPISDWLNGAIGFLSDQEPVPPGSESERIATLLQLLRAKRCLLVLGAASHQSCLLVTSREVVPELAALDEAVRHYELRGLDAVDAETLLADKQLTGDGQAWERTLAQSGTWQSRTMNTVWPVVEMMERSGCGTPRGFCTVTKSGPPETMCVWLIHHNSQSR
jgi:hypothetical protein